MKLVSHLPRQSPWLYVTPLLNAILLLLVCFLFSSGFVEQSGIKVEKPRSSSRLTGFDRAHIITLAGGDDTPIYFDGKKVTWEQLRTELTLRRGGERLLLLHTDRQAPAGRFAEVGSMAMEMGYEVALSTTPPAESQTSSR
jgi:biopolymer transport protein ExbD